MSVRTVTVVDEVAVTDQAAASANIVVSAGAPARVAVRAFDVTLIDAVPVLIAPVGVSVPGARPAFTVTADTPAPGLTIEIQWASGQLFTPVAGTATVQAATGDPDALVAVRAPAALADGVWWWRARLTGAGVGAGAWSAPASFAALADEGVAVLAGSWQISAAVTAAPHLWHLDPDSGTRPGESARLFGTGFGANPVVRLGDTVCPITAADDIPATGAGTRIEPGVVCEPWHTEIVFTIPDLGADADGDALTVQRGD